MTGYHTTAVFLHGEVQGQRSLADYISPTFRDFPGGSEGKDSACNVGDPGSILGRSPGEGNGYPLRYSCLENPMDRGAWWVHGVTKSWHDWATNTFTPFMMIHGCQRLGREKWTGGTQRTFRAAKLLCMMMDTCHCTCLQTQRMHSTKM